MKKDDLFPIFAKVHEMEEEIKLMSEKLDHLYAISLAGSSKIASLLAVQLRPNQLGRTLVQDEVADTVKRINQEMADDYLKIVRGFRRRISMKTRMGRKRIYKWLKQFFYMTSRPFFTGGFHFVQHGVKPFNKCLFKFGHINIPPCIFTASVHTLRPCLLGLALSAVGYVSSPYSVQLRAVIAPVFNEPGGVGSRPSLKTN